MTDKELRHLNRSELLQMLITQGEENRRLKQELEEANKKLNERQLVMENAGSIAEASLQLSGIFEAAEKAAQQYLDSVKSSVANGATTVYVAPDSINPSAVGIQDNSSCIKTEDMTGDEYWEQVKKRVQSILDGQE